MDSPRPTEAGSGDTRTRPSANRRGEGGGERAALRPRPSAPPPAPPSRWFRVASAAPAGGGSRQGRGRPSGPSGGGFRCPVPVPRPVAVPELGLAALRGPERGWSRGRRRQPGVKACGAPGSLPVPGSPLLFGGNRATAGDLTTASGDTDSIPHTPSSYDILRFPVSDRFLSSSRTFRNSTLSQNTQLGVSVNPRGVRCIHSSTQLIHEHTDYYPNQAFSLKSLLKASFCVDSKPSKPRGGCSLPHFR